MKDKPLSVEIKDDQLVISIGINTLAFASSWENGGPVKDMNIPEESAEWWAKQVAYYLKDSIDQCENSALNNFLDQSIIRAAE